jgi:hypothetical protein
MGNNFIIVGLILVIVLNLAFYFLINKKKNQKDLDDYLKKRKK